MVEQPNCIRCQHYYITYEPRHPYGCRAMGFKSRRKPAMVVFDNSGMICQLFSPKKKNEKNGSGTKRFA